MIKKIATYCRRAVLALALTAATEAGATTLVLPGSGDVVGNVFYASARSGDTILDLAQRYDIGYDQMIDANRGISPNSRLGAGTQVLIPGQYILPPVPRKGIVINLAELRLYYYPPGRNVVVTKPIGIGREDGWDTPVGVTTIVSKTKNPIWRPTPAVRAYAASQGHNIPEVFPPGPDNPMGTRAMHLGWPAYAIHGTNLPESVGGRVSAGCIRLMPEDIEELYDMVSVGTQVRVVNEPFKAGVSQGKIYFEAHRPLKETREKYSTTLASVVNAVNNKAGQGSVVSWSAVKEASRRGTGVPEVVSVR